MTKLITACAIAAAASIASADLIRITATGTINSSIVSGFSNGQTMQMELVYESDGNPQLISNRQAFFVDHIRSVSFIAENGWSVSDTGTFGQINKYDNLANTDGIQFQVAANPLTYQFTNPKPQAVDFADFGASVFDTVFINFASSSGTVWDNYNLPESYDFTQFDATQNALFLWSTGSFLVGWSNVQASVVPVPATPMLVLVGLATAARRRR
tara:strand:- start:52146 stop:52784 length:639 start_codon:yes stop_codon:yes gene_type:complete